MFAVDHATTALLIKRRFPSVSLMPMLLAVQAMELAWVGLNYLGIERTTTETSVRSVADIHLAYMPFSHSVATATGAALLAWLVVEKGFGRALLGRAIGIGIFSHLVLDLVTHARDIALWPGSTLPALGLGLYDGAPMWGFALEMAYGVMCWRVYKGSWSLLAMILVGNLANITLFSAAIPGPEQYLGGHPLMVVTMVFAQIVTTLALVYVLAMRRSFATDWLGTTHGGFARPSSHGSRTRSQHPHQESERFPDSVFSWVTSSRALRGSGPAPAEPSGRKSKMRSFLGS